MQAESGGAGGTNAFSTRGIGRRVDTEKGEGEVMAAYFADNFMFYGTFLALIVVGAIGVWFVIKNDAQKH